MSKDSSQFEDLTLAQLIHQFMKSPGKTWRTFNVILSSPRENTQAAATASLPPTAQSPADLTAASDRETPTAAWRERLLTDILTIRNAQLPLCLIAVACGLFGNSLLRGSGDTASVEAGSLTAGAPFLWMSFFIWLLAELVGHWTQLQAWWHRIDHLSKARWIARLLPLLIWLTSLMPLTDSMTAPAESALELVSAAIGRFALGSLVWLIIELVNRWLRHRAAASSVSADQTPPPPQTAAPPHPLPLRQKITPARAALFILAAGASILVWTNTNNNQIAPPIIILWLASAVLWALAFAPLKWNCFEWATERIDAVRRIRWREHSWAIIAFALIMTLGMRFRLAQLEALPPEMTSDMVEDILDSIFVFEGDYRIFFSNLQGREPLHYYLMSMLATLPGLGFNHFTLKLLGSLEGLAALPILAAVGIELMGERRRKFGLLVGLILAGLVAVSYWHAALGRLGMRIVLAPLFTSLLMIYLARAMRHNRRADYVKAALALGFGLYSYQAMRMLPLIVVAGLVIATAVRQISWRVRLMYGVNLAVLVFVSFMVFLPLFHYSLENPENFWRRASGRVLGDGVAEGIAIGAAGAEEQLDAFTSNVPILMSNIRNALLMFHWKGDNIWLHGVPHEPAMDMFTGVFLILGLAAWAVNMLKSRDPVLWSMPVMIFIMLLPSALSIAFPAENPSHTRVSGVMPLVYLVAAVPIAIIARHLRRAFPGRRGIILAVIFCSSLILLANHRNTRLYFDRYLDGYISVTTPQSELGAVLRGFADSGGAYGNAFIIAYPHFLDHRAVGIEAGEPFWPNNIGLSDTPRVLDEARQRTDRFKLNPDRDLLFFYSPHDEGTPLQLRQWFPSGHEQKIQSSSHPDQSYMLYRVPFLGEAGLETFLSSHS